MRNFITLIENTLPAGSSYPKILKDGDEIAAYIAEISSSYVDEEFISEYFFDSRAVLKLISVSDLKEGGKNHNIPSKAKHKKYAKLSTETMPPLIVENGVVVDGNHRFRVGKEKGMESFWCYDVEEAH